MIARAVAVFVERQLETVVCSCQKLAPLFRRSDTADHEFAIFHAANHVHVDHRDSFIERPERVIHVVIRAEQSFLFATERDEDECAFELRSLRAEDAREFEYARGSRGVVISAVMDLTGTRRE